MLRIFKKLAPAMILAISASFLAASASADIVISPFAADQQVIVAGSPAGLKTEYEQVVAPGSIGGFRDLIVTRIGPATTRSIVSADSNVTAPGFFTFNTPAGVTASVELQFDGDDDSPSINPTGLGGMDLTEGGANLGFLVRGISDLGAPLTITVYSDAGNASQATAFIPADPNFSVQDFFIPFVDFTAIAGGGADFTSVGALSFLIDGSNSPSLDVKIDFIVVTVPEPSALALCGLGLIVGSAAGVSRRRRAAARD